MRPRALGVVLLLLCTGCTSDMLRRRTNEQVTTLDALYYQQVLDNMALIHDKPAALPAFALPSLGSIQVQRALSPQYQISPDFITSGAAAFIGRLLIDKETAQLQATLTEFGQWQVEPDTDPDRLLLMRSAYHRALGVDDPEAELLLEKYYDEHPASRPYATAFLPGWYCVGRKCDVPKHACYVGHHCSTYVWVPEEHLEQLSRFTLAMMDFDIVDTVWTDYETGPTRKPKLAIIGASAAQ